MREVMSDTEEEEEEEEEGCCAWGVAVEGAGRVWEGGGLWRSFSRRLLPSSSEPPKQKHFVLSVHSPFHVHRLGRQKGPPFSL